MNIDNAINRLNSCHPITEEDKEVFELAVRCMEFTKDFLLLNATPERMKHALNLLNSFEYAFKNSFDISISVKNINETNISLSD